LKKSAHKPRRISRREFARGSALAAASAAYLPNALAQQTPAPEPALSAEGQTEVDIKVAAVLRQYGTLLTNEEKLDLRRLLTEGQKPLDAMRQFITENWDQPADVLKLYPEAPAVVEPPTPESRRK
jgi:hypothetical protein